MRGLMLDSEFNVAVSPQKDRNGLMTQGAVIGDNANQCAALVLSMSQGDLKEDPLLGCALTKFIRGKYNSSSVEARVRAHFNRAGLRYDDFLDKLNLNINTNPL